MPEGNGQAKRGSKQVSMMLRWEDMGMSAWPILKGRHLVPTFLTPSTRCLNVLR